MANRAGAGGHWATEVFQREEWKNARTMARVRSAAWFGLGLVGTAIDLSQFGTMNPASLLAFAWGAISALVSHFVFCRFGPAHGNWVRIGLVSIDLTVLALCFSASQQFLGHTRQGEHSLYGMALAISVLIISNVLNAAFRPIVWAVSYGTFLYLLMLWRHGALDYMAILDVGLLVALAAIFFYSSRNLRRALQRVAEREALARFLPAQVVDLLATDPKALSLGGVEQEATILFADIRAFTTLSEQFDPVDIVAQLNEYFAEMVDEIFRFRGTLDKFIGDGICAVFGTPLAQADQARNAVSCALAMLTRLERLNERRQSKKLPPLQIGIGLHTGKVIAGNIGSPRRLEYTHIGDAVNTASRIESVTQTLGVPLLVSAETFVRAGGAARFRARRFAPVQLKGKAQPIEMYAVESEIAPPARSNGAEHAA